MEFKTPLVLALIPIVIALLVFWKLRRKETAFLFSSGYAADLFPASVLSDLQVELLQKPYDPDQLLRVVRRTLDARAAKAAHQTPSSEGGS